MSTVFSGGTYVNNGSLDGSSKNNLIFAGASGNNIQSALTTAGWSVVSGSGTNNLLMQSAQDPVTLNRGRVRFKDNGGTCVQVTIENVSGSQVQTSSTTHGGNLLPGASKVFRILASKYRFEIFTAGTSQPREFVCAGILWIPAPYQGVITECIYMQGNAISDTDTGTTRLSFRNSFSANSGSSSSSNQSNAATILNGAISETFNSATNYPGTPGFRIPGPSGLGAWFNGSIQPYQNAYRWHDLALDQADALMAFDITNNPPIGEALIRGQVYDWTILSDVFTLDSTDSWSDGGTSHNFYCLMNQIGGVTSSAATRGSIWVAYS